VNRECTAITHPFAPARFDQPLRAVIGTTVASASRPSMAADAGAGARKRTHQRTPLPKYNATLVRTIKDRETRQA
jgi:hypothetical protein